MGMYLLIETNASYNHKDETNLKNEGNEVEKGTNTADQEMQYLSNITQLESDIEDQNKYIAEIDQAIQDLEKENKVEDIGMIRNDETGHKQKVDKIILDEENTSETNLSNTSENDISFLKRKKTQLEQQIKDHRVVIEQPQQNRHKSQLKKLDPTYIPGKAIVYPIVAHTYKLFNIKAGGINYITTIIQAFLSPFGVCTIFYELSTDTVNKLKKGYNELSTHLSSDNRFLFIGDWRNRLQIYNLETGVCVRKLYGPYNTESSSPASFQVSKDDRILLAKYGCGREYVFQPTWNSLTGGYSIERFQTLSMWREFVDPTPEMLSKVDVLMEHNSIIPWGMSVNLENHFSQWRVWNVVLGSQAHSHKIQIGWRLLAWGNEMIDMHNYEQIKNDLRAGIQGTIQFEKKINYTFVGSVTSEHQFMIARTHTNRITAWYLDTGAHYGDFYFPNDVHIEDTLDIPDFLVLARDNKWLIIVTRRPCRITVWYFQTGDVANEKIFYDNNGIFANNRGSVERINCLTTDEQWIITTTTWQTLKICNLPELDTVYTIETSHKSVGSCAEGQNSDGRIVAVGPSSLERDNQYIEVWLYHHDFSHGRRIHNIPFVWVHGSGSLNAYSLSSNGRILIAATTEDSFSVWNTNSGKLFNYYDVRTTINDNAEEN